jgi:acetolactate synthase I/II/III large subunit
VATAVQAHAPQAHASAQKPTGGRLVVESLRALGVRFMFGVPGGQTLAITDAVRDANDIRFVTTRHEGAAACMADAIGRLTGSPGVCIATTGPGATNLLTGIGGAFRDSSPVIAITCNNRLADLDRDDAQGADHIAIFRSLVKWAKLVVDVKTIPQVIEEAFIRATSGCPGPVLLDFARDVLEGGADSKLFEVSRRSARLIGTARERVSGDPSRIAEAARLLKSASKPTIWLGNGAKLSRCGAEALKLASQLDMPIITTFNGIGAVPTTDPLVYGALSRMGTELSSRVLADTDVLLAVGNSFNAISTSRWSLKLPETIIQVDIEPTTLGRYYAAQTFGIVGDALGTLAALNESLKAQSEDVGAAKARQDRFAKLSPLRREWWRTAREPAPAKAGVISPDVLMQVVRKAAPDDTIAVFDAGNPGVWSYLWEVTETGGYMKPVGFGNMGFGVPAAIAAKLQSPEKPVIAFVGDGSLGMTLGELETIAREDLPLCIVVMNDRSYGNIRQEQIVHFGGRTIGVDFTDVDYAAVARASGLAGVRVNDAGALSEAIREALKRQKPTLVEAMIDRDVNAWTYPSFRRYELGD